MAEWQGIGRVEYSLQLVVIAEPHQCSMCRRPLEVGTYGFCRHWDATEEKPARLEFWHTGDCDRKRSQRRRRPS